MIIEYLHKYKSLLSLSFSILFSITSLLWQKNPFTYTTLYFAKITEQANYFIKNIFNFPFQVISTISEYKILREKYEKSIEELEKYKSQKEKYEVLLKENQKFREILDFETNTIYPEIKAKVLGIRLNSITPRIIVNKGKKHNIKPFMPVIAFTNDENRIPIRAVVGITAIVQDNTSIIQPLQHPQMKLGVKIENTNQWAILEGNNHSLKLLKLKYISNTYKTKTVYYSENIQDIYNSRVVTSGNDGIFPPNLLVGKVVSKVQDEEEGFNIGYVEPYISLDQLDFVIIISKEPEEWHSLLQEEKEMIQTPFGNDIIPETLITTQKKLENKNEKTNSKERQNNTQITKSSEKEIIESKRKKIFNPNDPFQY